MLLLNAQTTARPNCGAGMHGRVDRVRRRSRQLVEYIRWAGVNGDGGRDGYGSGSCTPR